MRKYRLMLSPKSYRVSWKELIFTYLIISAVTLERLISPFARQVTFAVLIVHKQMTKKEMGLLTWKAN